MKLLVILNEGKRGAHDDIYGALDILKEKSELTQYEVIPFLELLGNGKSQAEVFTEIFLSAKGFQPQFILWSHTTNLDLLEDNLKKLTCLLPNVIMAYWDGDIYQSPYKRLPRNVIELCKASDVVFAQGFGQMTEKLKAAGCKDIRFVPAATSTHRFQNPYSRKEIKYDVVLIGNKIIRKNPFLTMPGTRLRVKLVKRFYKEFGDRFAVYGSGWKGAFAKGPIPFLDQINAYKESRIVLGCNNLHSKYYFSNRLPIALSSGVPVLYNREDGVDSLFTKEFPIWFDNAEDAIQKAQQLLSKDKAELDAIGEKGKLWTFENMSTIAVFSYMLKVMKSLCEKQNEHIANPWTKNESL